MKTLPGLKIRPLGKDFLLVPQSGGLVDFNKIISLNRTAAYLWESVAGRESFTKEDLSALLADKYGIDSELADADAAKIAQKWLEAGITVEQ